MDEFVDRMSTQRHVLNAVNSSLVARECLFGLSSIAIDRWAAANQIGPTSDLVISLKRVSAELFFMATRSQEPVSSQYELRRSNIVEAVKLLEKCL